MSNHSYLPPVAIENDSQKKGTTEATRKAPQRHQKGTTEAYKVDSYKGDSLKDDPLRGSGDFAAPCFSKADPKKESKSSRRADLYKRGRLKIPNRLWEQPLSPMLFRFVCLILNGVEKGPLPRYFLGNTKAATSLGLGRSTVQNLKRQLVGLGWLRPHIRNMYALSGLLRECHTTPKTDFTLLPRVHITDPLLDAYAFRLLSEYLLHPDWAMSDKYLAEAARMSPRQVRLSRNHLLSNTYIVPVDDEGFMPEDVWSRKGFTARYRAVDPVQIADLVSDL